MEKLNLFQSVEFGQVRTVIKNGDIWFIAKDICDCLDVKNVSDALSRIDEDEKGIVLTDTQGGKQEMATINESGLYSLILSSRKAEAKKFKKWITSEVIPSIRKTGGYIIEKEEDTPAEIMARALLVAQDTLKRREERIKALENKVTEDEPRVEFAKTVEGTSEKILIGDLAKLTDGLIGRNRLFKLLKENKILMKDNKPYQNFIDRGYFEVTERIIKAVNKDIISFTTYVTGKGQIWLLNKIKELSNKEQG